MLIVAYPTMEETIQAANSGNPRRPGSNWPSPDGRAAIWTLAILQRIVTSQLAHYRVPGLIFSLD